MLTITLTARETHMITLALFAASRDVEWMAPDNKKYFETMRGQLVDAWVEQNPEYPGEPWEMPCDPYSALDRSRAGVKAIGRKYIGG